MAMGTKLVLSARDRERPSCGCKPSLSPSRTPDLKTTASNARRSQRRPLLVTGQKIYISRAEAVDRLMLLLARTTPYDDV